MFGANVFAYFFAYIFSSSACRTKTRDRYFALAWRNGKNNFCNCALRLFVHLPRRISNVRTVLLHLSWRIFQLSCRAFIYNDFLPLDCFAVNKWNIFDCIDLVSIPNHLGLFENIACDIVEREIRTKTNIGKYAKSFFPHRQMLF